MIHVVKSHKKIAIVLTAVFAVAAVVTTSIWIIAIQNERANAARKDDWIATNIISDAEFTNNQAMSVDDIQQFLNQRIGDCDIWGASRASEFGSNLTRAQYAASRGWQSPPYTCLNLYYEVPKTSPGGDMPANNYSNPSSRPGGSQSAAWIIKNAADRYNISPKVLLVKLATESTGPLTSDKWPLFNQYRYAMGAFCPDSGPGGSANCDPAYSGFSLQMYEGARLMRWYLDSMNEPWWQYKRVGSGRVFANGSNSNYVGWNVAPRNCGGTVLNIETRATAALYTYTPYQPNDAALNNMYGTGDNCSAYGNRNFWRVYWDWFGDTRNSDPYRWSLRSINIYSDEARTQLLSDDGRVELQPGQTAYVTVEAENIGKLPWDDNTLLETTNHSMIRGESWIAYNKAAKPAQTPVQPGSRTTYTFDIKAPQNPGAYTQLLNIQDNKSSTWLNSTGLSIRTSVTTPLPHPSTTDLNVLRPGEVMRNGDIKFSPERHTVLRMNNGQLELYQNFVRVWTSHARNNSGTRLVNQGDGNLVIYNASNQATWASDTHGGNSNLVLQVDGNVVLYQDGRAIWATHSSITNQLLRVNTNIAPGQAIFAGQRLSTRDRKAALVLQNDGNLVLYNRNQRAIWATNTDGRSVNRAVFQADGNLVLYTTDNRAVWASHTDGRGSTSFVLQEDLNLVMYTGNGAAIWSSGTYNR